MMKMMMLDVGDDDHNDDEMMILVMIIMVTAVLCWEGIGEVGRSTMKARKENKREAG